MIKAYIEFNTQKRKESGKSGNNSKKGLFKLNNNSIYIKKNGKRRKLSLCETCK